MLECRGALTLFGEYTVDVASPERLQKLAAAWWCNMWQWLVAHFMISKDSQSASDWFPERDTSEVNLWLSVVHLGFPRENFNFRQSLFCGITTETQENVLCFGDNDCHKEFLSSPDWCLLEGNKRQHVPQSCTSSPRGGHLHDNTSFTRKSSPKQLWGFLQCLIAWHLACKLT